MSTDLKAPEGQTAEPASLIPFNSGIAHVMFRLSPGYAVASGQIVRQVGGGDLLEGMLLLSIVHFNVQELVIEDMPYPMPGVVAADHLRKPVSVYKLAKEMGLKYDTARRHVNNLLMDGKVVRVQDGLIVPAAFIMKLLNSNLPSEIERLCKEFNKKCDDLIKLAAERQG